MHEMNGRAAIVSLIGLLLARAPIARAAEEDQRLAVVIIADGDPDLSDSLTEVAIAKLAQRRDHRLVGLHELQAPLGAILDGRPLRDCAEQPRCVARIGAAAAAATVLLGDVRREGSRSVVQLWLAKTAAGTPEAEFSETVSAELPELIATVRAGLVSLFQPRPADREPRPAAQSDVDPKPLPPASQKILETSSGKAAGAEARPRGGWLSTYGYAAGGVAIVTLSAAAVTGSLATEPPAGATRAEAQSDLASRERYASVASTLYGVGGAIAFSAVAALVWQWLRN